MAENFSSLWKHESTNPRSMDSTTIKETHTETHYSQTVERQRQRENFESNKRKVIPDILIQEIFIKIIHQFLKRRLEVQKAVRWCLRCWKKKNKKQKTANKKFYIWQNRPSKFREELKRSKISESRGSSFH